MTKLILILAGLYLTGALTSSVLAAPPAALTPPMGWNSYDAFGTSITEEETLANARVMKEKLLSHGWNFIVIDARWYDSVSSFDDRDFNKERGGAKLFADEFGRMIPATNRFPSAVDGNGFKPLADQIHSMGLKFGFHMMRGIPRQAVNARMPIQGSNFTAADAGDPKSTCGWCPDMFGVRDNDAGQAWYNSCAGLWASWGLDFVKVDDLSAPYHAPEIEMIRKAIEKCGRPIVFSTSPGPTDPKRAAHVSKFANMWRISGDFWDRWKDLDHQFDLLGPWQDVGGPGHWPDADMIPFGHIGIKCTIAGPDRQTRFTPDEQRTLMSLWSLAPSPLMLGANLIDLDEPTLALLTNDEVLEVNQDLLVAKAKRVFQRNKTEVWVRNLNHGEKAVGLFNRGDLAADVDLVSSDAGLSGAYQVRDLWMHRDLGPLNENLTISVPSHGAVLLRVKGNRP
jgi:alpha-galactosidase